MPVDQKRINGPEASHSYKVYSDEYLKALETELSRTDRKNNENRQIFLDAGILSNARGSAYIEMGRTKLAVAVFDPREIPKSNKYKEQGDLNCDFKFAPFSCTKRKPPMPDAEEKCLALALKRALQPAVCRYTFPNFQVDIFVSVLENDGSCLAAAITAAGLAIANAAIPTYDVITAATVAVNGDRYLLDPTAAEEEYCSVMGTMHGIVTVSRLAALEQTEMHVSGFLSPQALKQACQVANAANEDIAPLVKQVLVKKVTKDMKALRQREKEAGDVVVVDQNSK